MPFDPRRNEGRQRFRRCFILSATFFVLILFSFGTSLILIYRHLDHKIESLTTVTAQDPTNNEDNDDPTNGNHNNSFWDDFNSTQEVTLNDVVNEVLKLSSQLSSQRTQIEDLTTLVSTTINNTVAQLNNTVTSVREDVTEQVNQVSHSVDSQNSLMAYQFAGTFAILGSLISFWHMSNHLRKLSEPFVQRKIVAILWMIPIYSVSSWLGLVISSAAEYLSLAKDLYEAYCIYTFLAFIIAVLGRGDRRVVISLLATHANKLKPPIQFKFWKPRRTFESPRHKAEAVMDQCQLFAMQFVFVRPLTSALMIIADAFVESRWDVRFPQFYIMMTANVSIFFAFTGLVKIYHAVQEELKWCHPFAKFLCIKGVVFMTFWQGIVISFVAEAVYRRHEHEGVEDGMDVTAWSRQAQSFLVCLEMFFFAIVHCFVFPPEEWEEGYREKEKERDRGNIGDNMALNDFFRDVKMVMKKKKGGKKIKSKRKLKAQGTSKQSVNSDGESSNGGSSSLVETTFTDMNQTDDSIYEVEELDMDWTQGWGRIEKYIIENIEGDGSGDDKSSDGIGSGGATREEGSKRKTNDLRLEMVRESNEIDDADEVVDLQNDNNNNSNVGGEIRGDSLDSKMQPNEIV